MRWSVVRPLLEIIGAKLLALTIGLFFCGLGLLFMRFGGAITSALNKDYSRMPLRILRFQYPSWWHRFMGWLFVGFGVLFAVTGLLFAHTLKFSA
jgi:hypothetical protein